MAQSRLEHFEKKLKNLAQDLELLKKYGIDEEILICWLQIKTKMSRKNIKLMLDKQQEFLDKLISSDIFDKLKEGN